MRLFHLALKMLWRDWRSGELSLLVFALLIAVTSSTAISLFADRLQNTFNNQAAEFLAADLAVSSPSLISPTWLEKATELGLKQSQTSEFPSVLLENQAMLLASIKAISDTYPLRGQLKISADDYDTQTSINHGPSAGQAWVDNRVLTALNLKLGDSLTVGEKALQISQVIRFEPDKRGDFYNFSPRVMINQADLAATAVIQPGSRVHYGFQFSGDEQALTAFKDWLKPQLNPSQRILDIHQDRPELGSALSRAERYLGLSSIVVILIAGVAIAMSTRRYSERHFNATALLRCLGCQQTEILRLYSVQFLLLGLLTCSLGCGLGWLSQQGLMVILKPLLPEQLASASGFALAMGFITGFAILLGFALPPLIRLQQVSPLRVLRRELEPTPNSAWLIYGLALGLVACLIWRYTNDLKMTLIILGGGFVGLLVLGLVVYGLLNLGRRALPRMSLTWRFGLQGLFRNPQASVSQILAFSITLTAMSLSYSVRNQLLESWQQQLPANAPNHFALNILPEQQADFAEQLQQAQIPSSQFYPIVRGRLVSINQQAVQQRVSKDSQGEAATQRELSLTWSQQLPADNKIISGADWQNLEPGSVSVEQKLADSLKIQVGDQLGFTIGSQPISAKVVNIRSVQWDTMQPNFYMIFSAGSLDNFPTTLMTSFYLAEHQKSLLTGLVKKYPATTILEVDQVLKQFKTILSQLTEAINILLYFALAAGFTVLLAAVYSSLDQRLYEGALLRTLGARRGLLRLSHLLEFCLIGAIAGNLACIASEAILYSLYTRVLQIEYHPAYQLWLTLPLLGTLIIGLTGYWGVRSVVKQPPLVVLKKT
jgi:putative ABC transport system permease protein